MSKAPSFQPFGRRFPAKYVEKRESELADFVVCMRVADVDPAATKVPSARFGECSKCGERVIFSALAPRDPPRLCNVCFVPDMGKQILNGKKLRMITTEDAITTTVNEFQEAKKRAI